MVSTNVTDFEMRKKLEKNLQIQQYFTDQLRVLEQLLIVHHFIILYPLSEILSTYLFANFSIKWKFTNHLFKYLNQ